MDCLHCVGDHQQEGLLEGGQPGLLVGDEQLEEDGLVEDGQLGGIPVFFCELQPSSCLALAVWDISFWGGGEHYHHDLGSCCTALDHSCSADHNHGRHHGVCRLGGHGSHGGRQVQYGAYGEE